MILRDLFQSTNRIGNYARCNPMARSWLKYLLCILFISAIFYVYLFINVNVPPKDDDYFASGHRVAANKIPRPLEESINSKVLSKSSLTKGGMKLSKLSDLEEVQDKLQDLYPEYQNFDRDRKTCTDLNVAFVCAGYNSTLALVTVVKSLLFYRSTPLHFHLLVDEIAKRTLQTLFNTWNLPQVNVTFYGAEQWIPKVSWVPNTHYSGVYGLLKLVLPEALAQEDKVLVLDTDVTLLADIFELWKIFEDFENEELFGMVENQSDWYLRSLSYGSPPWPALGRGFNTGIILMDLKRLRERDFFDMWQTTAKKVLKYIPETRLADQDIINAIVKDFPRIVRVLDCSWNIQLSDHTISETCYGHGKKIKIVHWNSPRKQDVRNKHVVDFRKQYQIFLELDGNLLSRRLFGCDKSEISQTSPKPDVCSKFERGSSIVYRTHLFIREYEYNVFFEGDVALVTQCSADRMTLLEELSRHWPGTISVALYLSDAEVQTFLEFVRNSEPLKNRKNIAFHIVYKDGEFYPVNYLRNIAMTHVPTPYIFQLDIDFLVQYGLYENLIRHISSLNNTKKIALIVPAFETQRYRFNFPSSKQELIKFFNHGLLYTFRYHVWAKGHAATNYTYWKNATQPYEIEWEPDFEPYLVVSRSAPLYDQRFIGFGWNKVSYVTHLKALGYKYIVLPDTFIIHRPHAPSLDIGKFRTDSLYRRCLKKLKDTFVEELIAKYGQENLSQLKKAPKDDKMPKTLQQT